MRKIVLLVAFIIFTGYLYSWYAVNDSRNIAPVGWYVPTDDDWKELEMYLSMSQSEVDSTGPRGTDERGKLKEIGSSHWINSNEGTTNESGFSALPGGFRYLDDSFSSMSFYAFFWSSTEHDIYGAWGRHLTYIYPYVDRYNYIKQYGFSICLVKDI